MIVNTVEHKNGTATTTVTLENRHDVKHHQEPFMAALDAVVDDPEDTGIEYVSITVTRRVK